MIYEWWFIGILLSLAASFFGTIGKVLMKHSHNHSDNLSIFIASSICVFFLNPCFDAISYQYAAQSVLAPMAGFSVVWNILLSPCILKEKLYEEDIRGTSIILFGCILVGITGNHEIPQHPYEEIFLLFKQELFIYYGYFFICFVLLLIIIIIYFPINNKWRRFAFGSLSGLIGGNLFFLKASVELINKGNFVFSFIETYLIILGALISAAGGILVLNIGLKDYDALYLVAVYQTFLILIGSISGVIFFHEYLGMKEKWQLWLYPFSILITIIGIGVLSTKRTEISINNNNNINEKTILLSSYQDNLNLNHQNIIKKDYSSITIKQ